MSSHEEIQTLDNHTLTPIAQKMLNDQSANVTDWKAHELQGGTIGKVYALGGNCHMNQNVPSTPLNSVGMEQANWSSILKIQKAYERFGDPDSWRREMLLYQSDLYDNFPKTLTVPICYNM